MNVYTYVYIYIHCNLLKSTFQPPNKTSHGKAREAEASEAMVPMDRADMASLGKTRRIDI